MNTWNTRDTIERPVVTPAQVRHINPAENQKQEPETPKMWRVILLNDHTTFPEFVTQVLHVAFKIPGLEARRIMMQAHTGGQATVKVSTKDLCQTQLAAAQAMIARAQPGVDHYTRVPACELKFDLIQES